MVQWQHPNGKKNVKTGGFLTVWMYACGNILCFTVFSNPKQSEFTFKIVVRLGIRKKHFYTINTIKTWLGRSWQGVTIYIYMFVFEYIYIYVHIYQFIYIYIFISVYFSFPGQGKKKTGYNVWNWSRAWSNELVSASVPLLHLFKVFYGCSLLGKQKNL